MRESVVSKGRRKESGGAAPQAPADGRRFGQRKKLKDSTAKKVRAAKGSLVKE